MIRQLVFVCTLITIACNSIKAQPQSYENAFQPHSKFLDKVFHPQSKENISVMRKSKEKIQLAIKTEDSIYFDTVSVKTYDKKGRLISYQNNIEHYIIKYMYDRKGRVIEYYEAEKYSFSGRVQFHFSIKYKRKGVIKAIENLLTDSFSTKVLFSSNTKILKVVFYSRDAHFYEYKINDDNRLVSVNSNYSDSKPYTTEVYYNADGKPIKEKGTTEIEIESTVFTTDFFYDKNKLVKEIIAAKLPEPYSTHNRKYSNVYTYLKELLTNVIVEVEVDGEVTFKTQSTYFYDSKNRLTKTVCKELKNYGRLGSSEVNYIYK